MTTIRTTEKYLLFREMLSNGQVLNLRAKIINKIVNRELQDNILTVVKVGSEVAFHVYVDQREQTLWLLGGHWVREGEPSRAFVELMHQYAEEILRGREPF